MKVIHVLKRIETLDSDIKDLKKLEKTLDKNKSFSSPIYLSIEKQINILLGERIKLLELTVQNPPESLVQQFQGSPETQELSYTARNDEPEEPVKAKEPAKKGKARSREPLDIHDDDRLDQEIALLTQDQIDDKIRNLEKERELPAETTEERAEGEEPYRDDNVKLLDLVLEKGLGRKENGAKDKKKVRFFRDNFPSGEY